MITSKSFVGVVTMPLEGEKKSKCSGNAELLTARPGMVSERSERVGGKE